VRALVSLGLAALVLAAPAGAAQLSRADRQAINRTLDAFVASAVKRHDAGASYDLVTPQLRAGTSRAAWAKGSLPVYPYPARGTSFHDWTIDYVLRNDVAFELMFQPGRGSKLDPIAFSGEVKKIRGRWLVDSFYPAATFAAHGAKVVGPRDFTAQTYGNDAGESRLSAVWFAVPGVLIAGILLVPLAMLLVGWRRGRKARRRAYRSPAEQRRDDEFWERLRARSSEGG
jgi:hypothetical protein